VLLVGRNHLHAQFPLGKVAVLDGFPQVAAVEVGVLAGDLLRLVPHQAVDAELGLPVELDEVAFAVALTKRKV
jgi:hypothetical protein